VSEINKESFGVEGIRSFLERQMMLRTVREGLIPHALGIKLLQKHFSQVEDTNIRNMYTKRKQHFLQGAEFKNGETYTR
jgi:hypothetical protein